MELKVIMVGQRRYRKWIRDRGGEGPSGRMFARSRLRLSVAWRVALVFYLGNSSGFATVDTSLSHDVRQLLNEQCTSCHGGVKRAGGISFIVRDTLLQPAKSGETAVTPGDADGSEMMRRVLAQDEDERMPPPEHGPRLAEAQIQLLRRWIEKGAPWESHWAYIPPRPTPLPEVSDPDWCRQPLDRFVLARLDKEVLSPSEPADRRAWLRRVTFDLIGLPPTLKEVNQFVTEENEGAFASVTDRLLASPQFGERWASVWLDLARYADSQGYEKDGGRTIWPYRDWLIRAFNRDMPFDEFTVRQLAGDLLSNATMDDLIATGFHRNTPTNTEGGTDDEEYRITAVLDRVATTWKTWQAISFNCVQCHSHPYEPIDHDEFYRFMAFFNTSRDWDLTSDVPLLDVPLDTEDFPRARELDVRLRALRVEEQRLVDSLRDTAGDWTPLTPASASSTLQTKLVIRPAENGGAEVLTEGTVSHDSEFTIDLEVPDSLERMTALRVEVLPRDPEQALFNPQLGFVLSHLRAQWVSPANEMEIKRHEQALIEAREEETQAKEKEDKEAARQKVKELEENRPGAVRWAHALGDEVEPFYDSERTLRPDKEGWGAMPRIAHPRQLILVPEEPSSVSPDARLRLVIRQEAAPNDMMPLVMNRSRYSLSRNQAWGDLVRSGAFVHGRDSMAELTKLRRIIQGVMMPYTRQSDTDLQRGTAVFVRGNWLNKGQAVKPAVPRLFSGLQGNGPSDRLAMAKWLVSPSNPLTARVAVNRIWEQVFGIGLVETVEDFGSSGQEPSHPELLDYLAMRFQNELGWSMKKLLREIVLSATYRQNARTTPDLRSKDPHNRLLARGPRNRLSAEMIRDNALAVSGMLSPRLYGPPVMPAQPDGIWRAARSSLKWNPSEGEDAHRRALYTYWRRSSPYPSLLTFDAPNRLVCSARRVTTSTPLQALVTLNDPVYIECARALAERMEAAAGAREESNIDQSIAHGFELAAGRRPDAEDLEELVNLYKSGLAAYGASVDEAGKLGQTPRQAALVLVANAILNLDVVLTK